MQDTDDFIGFGDDEIAITASAVANRRREIVERYREDFSADYAENVESTFDVVVVPATGPAPKKKKIPERKAAAKKLPNEEPKPKAKEKQPTAKTPAPEPSATPPEVRSTPRRRESDRNKKEAVEQMSDRERANEAAHSILSEKLQEILAAKKKKKNATRASLDEESAQEKEIVPKKKAKRSKEEPPAQQPSSGNKQLIRPSKLGGFGSAGNSVVAGSRKSPGGSAPISSSSPAPSSATPTTTPTRLFGGSPSELIVEGKRAWKPSAKVQEKMDAESPEVKQFITQYADAMAKKDKGGGNKAKQPQDEGMQKIERILKGESTCRQLIRTWRHRTYRRSFSVEETKNIFSKNSSPMGLSPSQSGQQICQLGVPDRGLDREPTGLPEQETPPEGVQAAA